MLNLLCLCVKDTNMHFKLVDERYTSIFDWIVMKFLKTYQIVQNYVPSMVATTLRHM